jgi:Cys-tRNA(Pro)/Cys-tRNA(Cys) deacylase
MTPAIKILESIGCRFTLHLYASSQGGNYGISAAEKLALDPEQVFKTLVIDLKDQQPVIALVPVSKQLHMKHLARCAGSKKAMLMPDIEAEKLTGYLTGGICPIGLKKPLRVYADRSVTRYGNVFISGGQRGLELEISSKDLVSICDAIVVEIAA